jgi:ribose transport system permease protein
VAADLATTAVIDGEPAGRAHRLSSAYRRLQYFREGGLVIALLLTALIFTLINSVFAEPRNLENISSQITYEGVIAVSMTYVIVTGEIDLSVGSMVAVTAVVFGIMLRDGLPMWGAILVTLAAGCGLGAVNGILSVLLRVPTIIITLGTLSAYRGLADQLANGYPISGFPVSGWFWDIGQNRLFGHIPYDTTVLIIFALISGFVLRRTTTGLHVYAMGSNRRAAELAGLHVNRIRVGVLAFNGFASALAALLAVSQTETADPNLGTGYELDVIAAVIIGGAKLTGGSGTVLASVLGLLLIKMIQNGLVIAGVSIYLLVVVSGLVVIAAVAIDRFFTRRREATVRG